MIYRLGAVCAVCLLPLSANAQGGDISARSAQVQQIRISQFSGEPVPRFVALKHSAVNGRIGPSTRHPIKWRYERRGLPVMVVKETRGWRKVRDPSGDEVWMSARMVRPAEAVMVRADIRLTETPDPASPPIADLKSGVLADLIECGQFHCKIETDSLRGWAPRKALWGVDTTEAGL